MSETLIRVGILLLVCLASWLIVWSGRSFVAKQRQHVLATTPVAGTLGSSNTSTTDAKRSPVRILAFSSDDCSQCHQLQAPALQSVVTARGEKISVVEIDAPNEPELTERYRVLTVPTTVVVDATGRAHAINYGFANAEKLLAQVDEVLLK